jgi:nucleoside-diphosphate-sugar epimerase
MNKTIWISGSRGFVGAQVAENLRSGGYGIKCISNSPSKNDNVIHTDFSDPNCIRDTIRKHGVPDTFIHLGWGNVYQPHAHEHLTSNLRNGMNLIDELFDKGVSRFVLIGSSSEYGARVGDLTEDLNSEGLVNNYIKGKTALAQYGIDSAERHGKKFIHVRLFYTYGAGQTHNSLINQLFQSFLENKPIKLSPCEQYRDYIHVSDAAEGIKQICNLDYTTVINLGGGRAIQLKEFVKLIWEQLGAAPELLMFGAHEQPVAEQSQPLAYANLTRLKSLTNWTPTLSIKEGIKKTVEQLFANEAKKVRYPDNF